jgi:hypothetical protein
MSLSPKLIQMPDRNLFPADKWKRLMMLLETLNGLTNLSRKVSRDLRLVEREVANLRLELLDAMKEGAAIENAGRIAG